MQNVMFHIGSDYFSRFNIVSDTDNDSLIAVEPQANFFVDLLYPFPGTRRNTTGPHRSVSHDLDPGPSLPFD